MVVIVRRLLAALLGILISLSMVGSTPDPVLRLLLGVRPGVVCAGRDYSGYLPGEVMEDIRALGRELYRAPKDATLSRDGDIVPEVLGRELDAPGLWEEIISAPRGRRIPVEYLPVEPAVTARVLSSLTDTLGTYTTSIGGSENRLKNIITASRAINNSLVLPGQVFSFNGTTGARTADRGYLPAPVIVGGTMIQAPGGGVCQVSSTLYNAVLKARLDVVERYPHSKKVGYVPPGRDATVTDTDLDFKFHNNRQLPVIVRAEVAGRSLRVSIVGKRES